MMNKKLSKLNKVVVSSALIMGMSLTGCGDNTKKKIADDYASNVSSSSDAIESASNEDVPEHVNFVEADKSGKVELVVDVDVDATGYNSARAYDVKAPKMDDKYILDLASKIFDNGTYTVEKPYELLSLEELEAERDYLEEKIEKKNAEDPSQSYEIGLLDEIKYYIFSYGEKNEDGVGEEYNSETETGIRVSGNELDDKPTNTDAVVKEGGAFYAIDGGKCRLRGMIFGEECELSANKDLLFVSIISINPHPYEKSLVGNGEASQFLEENEMTEGDASEMVSKFLSRIGKGNYEEVSCDPIAVGSDEFSVDATEFGSKIRTNGYGYCFSLNVNGIRVASEMEQIYDIDSFFKMAEMARLDSDGVLDEEDFYAFQEGCSAYQDYIMVDVDNYGLKRAWIYGMYDIGDSVSDNVNLLGMDQVVDIIKNYWKTQDKDMIYGGYYSKMEVTGIKLRYIVANYGSKYTLVPAWIVDIDQSDMKYEWYEPMERIAINALDGTVFTSGFFVWGDEG